MKIEIGDWVCFMQNGLIVYGKVEYVRKSILGSPEYVTTVGSVAHDYVLECRKANK